jgi:hypothetical protein
MDCLNINSISLCIQFDTFIFKEYLTHHTFGPYNAPKFMTSHVKLITTIFLVDINKIEERIYCIAWLVFFSVQVNTISVILLSCTFVS